MVITEQRLRKNREKNRKWKTENRQKSRELERESYHKNREKRLKYKRQKYRKDKEKHKIYNNINYLERLGFLKKEDYCDECSSPENLVKHHSDYSKPLEFITLCKSCHNRLHNFLSQDIKKDIKSDKSSVFPDNVKSDTYSQNKELLDKDYAKDKGDIQ